MKSENKKSLQNLENNSTDVNEVKGGKRFNLRSEFVNEPGQNEEMSEFAKKDAKYLTETKRPSENIRDNYNQEGGKGPKSVS
ncbi:MAG: hypothetical protein N4A46_12050 [Schleiferiaceae bacterium]|jgi:hypothetical protein|nr:hypothetical protein [Schleiferiaceae bacterium]